MQLYGITYQLSDFPDGSVIPTAFTKQMVGANISPQLVKVEVRDSEVDLWFDRSISLSDALGISAVVTAHHGSLAVAKQAAFATIDKKTDEIIARGFPFAGKVFSTSIEAQARMLGMDMLRTDPNMQFPITWNVMDDTDSLQIADADTAHAFVLTGIGYYRAAIDSGSALKAAVRAATTLAAVEAVTDART
jgi:hypothetical protein